MPCNEMQCRQSLGQWVSFRTQWGMHRGIVQDVNQSAVLVRLPRQYAPGVLLSHDQASENHQLDVALAAYGYPGFNGYYGGGYGRYGNRWGAPGYGIWRGGWWFWWLAFAWILALAFLW